MELHEMKKAPNSMIANNGSGMVVPATTNGNQCKNFGVIGNQHQQQINLTQAQQHLINTANRGYQGPRFISEQNHRELPVDVPDSFVGYAKESPRYPPTKKSLLQHQPAAVGNSHLPAAFNNNNNRHLNHQNVTSQQVGNGNKQASRYQLPAGAPTNNQAAGGGAGGGGGGAAAAASLINQNSSLRSSIKLKQLEKTQSPAHMAASQLQPAINQAFELNEEDALSPDGAGQSQLPSSAISNQQRALKMKQSMPDLCSIYNRLQRNLNGEFSDTSGDAKLIKLLSIYNTIVKTHDKQFCIPNLTSNQATKIDPHTGSQTAVVFKVTDLLQSVRSRLRKESETHATDVEELLAILCKHEIDGVCSAFDRIAQSFEFAKSPTASYQPLSNQVREMSQQIHSQSTDMNDTTGQVEYLNNYPYQRMVYRANEFAPDQMQMSNLYQNNLMPMTDIDLNDEACTKIVRIDQNPNQPLGATIRNEDGGVVIGRIISGGAAYKSCLLNEGDELLEVNGISLRGKNVNEVVSILQGIQGTITFLISPRNYQPMIRPQQEKLFVRTFFKYHGENDRYIPCKELGLSFDRNTVLTIIDQSDPRWWQARRESDSEWLLAGLIPSIDFLKEREKEANQEDAMTNVYHKREHKNLVSFLFNCPQGASPMRKKKNPSFGLDEIPYYEEVALYYPDNYFKRPVLLVGPKNIGQSDIIANLMRDTNRFARAVSHTSKPPAAHERDGVSYYFVQRDQFKADQKLGKFIESGKYHGQYYGTSLQAIKDVMKARKTCVHQVNTNSFLSIRQGQAGRELKPFFVFVRPDDEHPDKFRNLVESYAKTNVVENMKAIMDEVDEIESQYLPFFDTTLKVSDIDRATEVLLSKIEKVEKEPQWVPAFWLDSRPAN